MLTRSDSCWFPDLIADAAIQIVEEGGTAALTLPAVARRLGVTPQAVHKRTGGCSPMMDRILSVVAHRWLDAQSSRWMGAVHEHAADGLEGLVSLLPVDPEALADLRVWLALVELGRTDREEPAMLARVRRKERELVAISVRRLTSSDAPDATDGATGGPHLSDDAVDDAAELVLALVYGLCTRLTDPAESLDVVQAERLLRQAVSRIVAAPERSGPRRAVSGRGLQVTSSGAGSRRASPRSGRRHLAAPRSRRAAAARAGSA